MLREAAFLQTTQARAAPLWLVAGGGGASGGDNVAGAGGVGVPGVHAGGGGATGGGVAGGEPTPTADPRLPLPTRGRFIVDARALHRRRAGASSSARGRFIVGARALHRRRAGASSSARGRFIVDARGDRFKLANHTTHPTWCCSFDSDGLRYTSDYTEDPGVDDWGVMTARYRDNPKVIGADQRNEVRPQSGTVPAIPNWARSAERLARRRRARWHSCARREPRSVRHRRRDQLRISPLPRPHLRPVANNPIRLNVPRKLVYAAHNDGYIGPSAVSGSKDGEMSWPEFQAQMYWALNPGPKPSGDDEPYALVERA